MIMPVRMWLMQFQNIWTILVFSALGGLHVAHILNLIPIEHDWDMLGRRVKGRVPENLADLLTKLLEEWRGITQDEITTVIRSLPRRMRAVVDARGGNTRY